MRQVIPHEVVACLCGTPLFSVSPDGTEITFRCKRQGCTREHKIVVRMGMVRGTTRPPAVVSSRPTTIDAEIVYDPRDDD